jgi:leucyl-tRNA synthetase
MEYDFRKIEAGWKKYWNEQQVYKVTNPDSDRDNKPKCYILDMFPYPSGAGLHVGHPLGYIASDIYARYKRQKGFNVLHPMGYDAFGLPAEQYALETGQHPAVTTEKNIARYREQLDNIGFCYDWSREVRTSDPKYYKWTQWIFLQLFHSWYNRHENKAMPISTLITIFEKEGNINNTCPEDENILFTADDWKAFSEKEKREHLMHYRLAYQGYAQVWWCEALGTVLANDEVVNGVSERGGFPVERKNMRQWFLRITEYAERLISSLDNLDWSEAMKEMQRNWIGKSNGAEVSFLISTPTPILTKREITVFTTRPDTIFGVDFMVLAPEHDLVDDLTTEEQRDAIDAYKTYVKSRSERERMSEVKQVTGCFTGAYATHPLTHKPIPIWIAEYVLAGYGTGAIMAVPSGDDRDHAFAKHFDIPITNIFGDKYTGDAAYSDKSGIIRNSGFLTGMGVAEANEAAISTLEKIGSGKRRTNYRLRDAGFSRQRYWGEPFPIVYIDDVPYGTDESPIPAFPQAEGGSLSPTLSQGEGGVADISKLPVELPYVESYKPGPEGQGPLANIKDWVNITLPSGEGRGGASRETNTMPGYAGSSWYFLRYMDPHNDTEFASRKATDYWNQVDLYVGGTEHAVGHLLYSRMWTKALCDLGHIGFDEPFKKLLNQGMIQGSSRFVFEVIFNYIRGSRVGRIFVSKSHYEKLKKIENDLPQTIEYLRSVGIDTYATKDIKPESTLRIVRHRININLVDGILLDIPAFKEQFNINEDSGYFVTEADSTYVCDAEVEKMSKSKYNVVNPDDIVRDYGADTFRMYEMFLGPIDVSKPWDTKGIEGVHRFLKKLWRLYADEQKGWIVNDEAATDAELRILHKTIKKLSEDIERFSFNTSVSQLMICVNELTSFNCHKRAILEPLAVAICPFAPHIAEELWHKLGHNTSVVEAAFPVHEEKYLTENSKKYPVAVNGKTRVELEFPLDIEQSTLEKEVLADETIQKWLEGKAPKKIIYVKGKMINVVV